MDENFVELRQIIVAFVKVISVYFYRLAQYIRTKNVSNHYAYLIHTGTNYAGYFTYILLVIATSNPLSDELFYHSFMKRNLII